MSADIRQFGSSQQCVGAAFRDVTPLAPHFLFGYPFVERMSTGVHDPLLASAIYFNDGASQAMFVAVDIIFLSKQQVAEVRRQISETTSIPVENIMVTATHTHSGPVTVRMISNEGDRVVPEPDSEFLRSLLHGIVEAACEAYRNAQPAEICQTVSRVTGLGTNRHDPRGPSLPEVPILIVRSLQDGSLIGLMCVCSMHPTVLHEDSTLISGDFPGLARKHLQSKREAIPVVYHMGAAGNQSPRHVTKANTFEEAQRLGGILGHALEAAIQDAEYSSDWNVSSATTSIDLPLRKIPASEQAEESLNAAVSRLEHLRRTDAPPAEIRTAECDWFGAEETVALARAQGEGRLQQVAQSCLPAEIQLIGIGQWTYVGWPGEVFCEFALEVRERYPHAFVITLANGELQGYLVTDEAVKNKTYESSNAVFASPDSANLLVEQTLRLIDKTNRLAPAHIA